MPSRTRRTPFKVKKNGTQTLPAPPETTEKRRKGTVSGRRSNKRQDSDTSDDGDEGKQHSNTRMEGEEDSGYEDQEEEKEGEARRHSGDEDAMSPESRRRHHNAGQTPAPEHESPGGAKKVPLINYRLELQGPRGDISLTCSCETRHLKICKQDTSCRCRWAERFHTDECNGKYTSAMAASQHSTSEDEDEEPDDQYCMTPGMKQTSPRTDKRSPPGKGPPRSNKRTRDGMTGAVPAMHEQGAKRGATLSGNGNNR